MLIHAGQIPYLPNLAGYYKNNPALKPIEVFLTDIVSPNRAILHTNGIEGEMVETPGHSDDSMSLVLDSGMAFTGDLVLPV